MIFKSRGGCGTRARPFHQKCDPCCKVRAGVDHHRRPSFGFGTFSGFGGFSGLSRRELELKCCLLKCACR